MANAAEIDNEYLTRWVAEVGDGYAGWWYLSFAKPGRTWIIIVPGEGFVDALASVTHRRLNPGGEVLGIPLHDSRLPGMAYRYRLLTPQQMDEAFKPWGGVCRLDGRGPIPLNVKVN